MKKTPRGIRNCNPGNLRHSNDKWQGMRADQTDKEFVQFTSMAYGYRALAKNMKTHFNKYGADTIRKLISRHAPSNENNTEAYIAHVCKYLGMKADDKIIIFDDKLAVDLCCIICKIENGVDADRKEVEYGVQLACL